MASGYEEMFRHMVDSGEAMRQAAVSLKKMYDGFTAAGFTDAQAMQLLSAALAATVSGRAMP